MRCLCLFPLILLGVLSGCDASGVNSNIVDASNPSKPIKTNYHKNITKDEADEMPPLWIIKNAPVEEVVKRIKEGMPYNEVEELLRPFVVTSARVKHVGGMYPYLIKYYELKGCKELIIKFLGEEVASVGTITLLTKWKYLAFDVGDKEASTAIEIAVRHMKNLIPKGEDLFETFKITPIGRVVTNMRKTVRLNSTDGQESIYEVIVFGEYSTHRLVVLDFLRGDQWVYQVKVDMNEQAVVPSHWEPSSTDIAEARKIADPSIAEFLKPISGPLGDINAKVTVEALGDYEYGPTRRIVVLDYSIDKRSKRIRVDLDNSALLE